MVEDRRARLRGTHSQHIPLVGNRDPGRIAFDESVDELPLGRLVCIGTGDPVVIGGHGTVDDEPGPHGRQRSEDLHPGQFVTAVGRRHRLGVRALQNPVVRRLRDAEGEDLTAHDLVEHPVQRVVAAVGQRLDHSCGHEVHVDRQSRSGCRRCQPLLKSGDLEQAQPRPAMRLRDEQLKIAEFLEFGEVFVEESVLPVIDIGPFAESFEHIIGQVPRGEFAHASFTIGHDLSFVEGSVASA